ncbi:MAG: type II toxin-antitoxin system VapC family toxin, partial [Desulfobacterales bacterium]
MVDTNIISYLFIEGEFTALSEKAFQKDHHWVAPFLWRSEFRNVLTACFRKGLLQLRDALKIVEQAEWLMRGNEFSLTSSSVLRLVTKSDCSAYDCEFVALARELRIPLITMDKKILKAFPETSMRLEDFI